MKKITEQPASITDYMPGTCGFTVACFHTSDVPSGTAVYTEQQVERMLEFRDETQEHIAGYQVWWGIGEMRPYDQLFKTKEEAEEYSSWIKSNTEIRTLYYKS